MLPVILKRKMNVCQFALDSDVHNKPETIVLEGKYWKREMRNISAEYKRWRIYYKNKLTGQDHLHDSDEQSIYDIDSIDWPRSVVASQFNMDDGGDFEFMDFSDSFFQSLPQQFTFPDTREIVRNAGISDFMQPSLVQLQPDLDLMDIVEPWQEMLAGRILTTVPEEESNNEFGELVSDSAVYIKNNVLVPTHGRIRELSECSRVADYQTASRDLYSDTDSPSSLSSPASQVTSPPSGVPYIQHCSKVPYTAVAASLMSLSDSAALPTVVLSQPCPTKSEPGQSCDHQQRRGSLPSQTNLPGAVMPPPSFRTSPPQRSNSDRVISLRQLLGQPIDNFTLPGAPLQRSSSSGNGTLLSPAPVHKPILGVTSSSMPQLTQTCVGANQARYGLYSPSHPVTLRSNSVPLLAAASTSTVLITQLLSVGTSITSGITQMPSCRMNTTDLKMSTIGSSHKAGISLQPILPAVPPSIDTRNIFPSQAMHVKLSAVTPSSLKMKISPWIASGHDYSGVMQKALYKEPGTSRLSPDYTNCKSASVDRGHYKEHRRVSHINAEQKRRVTLKTNFDVMHSLIPSVNRNPNSKVSKAALLQKGAEYIMQLKADRKHLTEVSENIRTQIETLNGDICKAQYLLPATSAPIGQSNCQHLHSLYRTYVHQRSLENWKFYMFSMITQPLLESYSSSVSTCSVEDLCRSSLAWLDQNCSLSTLRPLASNSMRKLSSTTNVLCEPERLPEEVFRQVTKQEGEEKFLQEGLKFLQQ